MISLHKEGKPFIILSTSALIVLIIANMLYDHWILKLITLIAAVEFLFIANFFRNPKRPIPKRDDALIYAPADGRIVAIEAVRSQHFEDNKATQISIFMSPLNVHVNRYPTSARVISTEYFPGKYLVASHPKASTLNEREEILMENGHGRILVRQIAGAIARRIVCYAEPELEVVQGSELGFIKFGSRVDILVPADTKILVEMNEKVKGNLTQLAEFRA